MSSINIEMEDPSLNEWSDARHVDTEGHCFLCLIKLEPELSLDLNCRQPFQYLCGYLKVDVDRVYNDGEEVDPLYSGNGGSASKLITVSLCEGCAPISDKFSELYKQLERIRMELISYLGVIQGRMIRAEETGLAALFRKSKKRRRETRARDNRKIVEALRKETMEKGAHKLSIFLPTIDVQKMTPSEPTIIKSTDVEFEGDTDPDFLPEDDDENSDEDFFKKPSQRNQSPPTTELADCSKVPNIIVKSEISKISRRPRSSTDLKNSPLVADNSRLNSKTGKRKCNLCSNEYVSASAFLTHYKEQHLKLRHECGLCGEDFVSRGNLTRHHRKEHLGVRFSCDTCHKVFPFKYNLRYHQRLNNCSLEGKGYRKTPKPKKTKSKQMKTESPDADKDLQTSPSTHKLNARMRVKSTIESDKDADPGSPPSLLPENAMVVENVGSNTTIESSYDTQLPDSDYLPDGDTGSFNLEFFDKSSQSHHWPSPPNTDFAHGSEVTKEVLKSNIPMISRRPKTTADLKNSPLVTGNSSLNTTTGKRKCNQCPREYISASAFLTHYKEQHLKLRHECGLCGQDFVSRGNLTRHHRKEHMGIRYSCDTCKRLFSTKTGLRFHQRLNNCSLEGKGFRRIAKPNPNQIKTTTKNDSGTPPSPPIPDGVIVEKVQKKIKYQRKPVEVVVGVEGVKRNAPILPPTIIEGEVGTPQSRINAETGKHECGLCSQEFRQLHVLQDHYNAIHLKRKFQCNICQKQFSYRQIYNAHYHKVHIDASYRCHGCNEGFTRKSKLQEHQRETSCGPNSDSKVQCHECGKEFGKAVHLKSHVNFVHLKLREHICDQCGRGFDTKGHLKKHLMTVHSMKVDNKEPLECEFCKKQFPIKDYLTNHMRVHTGEKPYVCEHCGKTFAARSNYNRHREMHSQVGHH